MYSDLYEVLGNPSAAPTAATATEEEKHIAVSFSAGKMELLKKEVSQLWKEYFLDCHEMEAQTYTLIIIFIVTVIVDLFG